MADWKPPDMPQGAWKPPDTPQGQWKPPDTPQGTGEPTSVFGSAASAKKADFGLSPQADPVLGSTVAPALNILDYPFRAGLGDMLLMPQFAPLARAIDYLRPGGMSSTDVQQKVKQAVIDRTALPETGVGKAIETIAAAPGTLISKSIGGASRAILGDTLTKQLAPYAEAAADLAPFGLSKAIARAPKELPPIGDWFARDYERERLRNVDRDLREQNRVRRDISRTYKGTTYEGGQRVQDVIDEMNKARHAGQPMVLPDLNLALERAIGSIYRAGGAASSFVKDFLDRRDKGANARVEGKIDEALGDQNLREAMKLQRDERSARAGPVWSDAMDHGSTAPFERQHQLAFGEAVRAQSEAQAKVAAADAALTQARARQATGGNVYADSAANQAVREAQTRLDSARAEVGEATRRTEMFRDLMRRAQEDRTANAPGATWSPGLQYMLDTYPEIRAGINAGIKIQRGLAADDVLAGRGFNPRDYAIVGTDAAGEPIIGAVPTMRLWHAAKVGLDEFLRSDAAHEKFGGWNGAGKSAANVRRVLVEELDRLNPKYKPARDLYAGDTHVLQAMTDGKQIFKENRFMDDAQVHEEFAMMGDSEKQAFLTGVRQELRSRLKRTSEGRDKSAIFATPFVRERLTAVLGPAGEKLLNDVEREHTFRTTLNRTTKGSPTAERVESDVQRASRQVKSVRDVLNDLFRGHPLRALSGVAGNLAEKFAETKMGERAGERQQRLNEIYARTVLDPNIVLNPSGPLLTPMPGEVSRFRPSPGAAYGIGTVITPEDRSNLLGFSR